MPIDGVKPDDQSPATETRRVTIWKGELHIKFPCSTGRDDAKDRFKEFYDSIYKYIQMLFPGAESEQVVLHWGEFEVPVVVENVEAVSVIEENGTQVPLPVRTTDKQGNRIPSPPRRRK